MCKDDLNLFWRGFWLCLPIWEGYVNNQLWGLENWTIWHLHRFEYDVYRREGVSIFNGDFIDNLEIDTKLITATFHFAKNHSSCLRSVRWPYDALVQHLFYLFIFFELQRGIFTPVWLSCMWTCGVYFMCHQQGVVIVIIILSKYILVFAKNVECLTVISYWNIWLGVGGGECSSFVSVVLANPRTQTFCNKMGSLL